MAAPTTATHYKDLDHNLGYKPIVVAYVDLDGIWRLMPILYEYLVETEVGYATDYANLYYEHIDNNTVRFYGLENQSVRVQLYLEPREDAWYE